MPYINAFREAYLINSLNKLSGKEYMDICMDIWNIDRLKHAVLMSFPDLQNTFDIEYLKMELAETFKGAKPSITAYFNTVIREISNCFTEGGVTFIVIISIRGNHSQGFFFTLIVDRISR